MAQITGIVRIKLNGKLIRSKQGASLQVGGRNRTAVVGHSLYGYSEEVAPSVCSFTIAHTVDVDIGELQDLVDAVLLFETDTGSTLQCNGMFVSTPPELTGGEGDLTVEMQGQPAIPLS
jgi:hypothetical protein